MPNNFKVDSLSSICTNKSCLVSSAIQPAITSTTSTAAQPKTKDNFIGTQPATNVTSSNLPPFKLPPNLKPNQATSTSNLTTKTSSSSIVGNRVTTTESSNFLIINIGDIFLANLWNTANLNRIEEGLIKLSQEGEFYTIQELNSCLDALHEVNLPRTSELKSRILALIVQANKVHQTNPLNNTQLVKNEPKISSDNMPLINNNTLPVIQKQSTTSINQLLAPHSLSNPFTNTFVSEFKQNTLIPIADNLTNKPLINMQNSQVNNYKTENLQTGNATKSQSYSSSNTNGCTICLESFDEVI